jgi:hypothetical protein
MTCTNDGFEHNLALTAREFYQVLKYIALGARSMTRGCRQSWNEIYHGHIAVEICWQLTLFNDCDIRNYPEDCRSPDDRMGALETRQCYGH